jgi:DhnA family fructose-bisphosphate aldolase class Ia
MTMSGKALRLARVQDPATDRALIAAVSHGILTGPVPGLATTEEFRRQVKLFADAGSTGLIVTPGYLRVCQEFLAGPARPALVLSLSWTNLWRGPELLGHEGFAHAHRLIATVEDAVRAGADMVHVYAHLGSKDPGEDAAEMERLGQVVGAADRWGLPVLCEPLARGTAVAAGQSNRRDFVALAARMAAEAGADMVKVEYTGDPDSFRTVVDTCAAPVVMMGGAPADRFGDFLTTLADAVAAGAKGVAVGRNLFLHPRPDLATRAVRAVLHGDRSAAEAAEELQSATHVSHHA